MTFAAPMAATWAEPVATVQMQSLQAALGERRPDAVLGGLPHRCEKAPAFLNDAPTARLEVARAYLRLGDRDAALEQTRGFLALGQTHAILATPLFVPLGAAISAQEAKNQLAVARAQMGVQADRAFAAAGRYRPSIRSRSDSSSRRCSPERSSPSISTALSICLPRLRTAGRWFALKIDSKRRRLWASEVAFNDFATVAESDRGRSVLLEYDLDHARLLSRLEAPAHTSLGDMALAVDGAPIVSDGEGGGLYRAEQGRLRRIDHGEFVSPQTPASCGDPNVVFVADYVRGLARLELDSGKVVWLSGDKHALYGIDGLYCRGHRLTATQNGASPARVVEFELDEKRTAVASERVIERATAGARDMTHGVFVGNAF